MISQILFTLAAAMLLATLVVAVVAFRAAASALLAGAALCATGGCALLGQTWNAVGFAVLAAPCVFCAVASLLRGGADAESETRR